MTRVPCHKNWSADKGPLEPEKFRGLGCSKAGFIQRGLVCQESNGRCWVRIDKVKINGKGQELGKE